MRPEIASRIGLVSIVLAVALLGGAAGARLLVAQRGPAPPTWPGYAGDGTTLLPNGWRIAPVGRHLQIGDLPLGMTLSPDSRYLIITNNGWTRPTLTIVDLTRLVVRGRVPVDHAWLGLAFHPDGKRLFSSGAAQNTVEEFTYAEGRLTAAQTYTLARPAGRRGGSAPQSFIGGVSVSPDGKTLFAVHVLGLALTAIDLERGRVRSTIDLPAEPYSCLVSPDGKTLFVSLWGGSRVLLFDTATLQPQGEIVVGEHPNAMALSRDGARLFVACANTNAVYVADLATRTASEQISVALYPQAPPGSTPNALAVSPDGSTLLVANADNNTVASVDIRTAGRSQVAGFIPTGWYPTGVGYSADGQRIFILSGKGLTSAANPRGAQPGVPGAENQYAGSMMQGTLTVLDRPGDEALRAHTRKVLEITSYRDATRLTPAGAPKDSPVPARVGAVSPIKHVFYVIRENRTYDQVFGDLERGNGDPRLCLFGEEVTPNAHALARQFVLLDNFYVDAEVSYDGHAFSTGAYATDFVEKMWPTNYGGRGGIYLSEGGGAQRNPHGNIAAPARGYLWDACKRANVTVRSYGEFAHRPDPKGPVVATVPGLKGLVHPAYPAWDLKIPDNRRVDVWLEEFRRFEQDGGLPQLSIIRLGGDHTAGTQPGMPTPRAMVAENDLALGRLVEAIAGSRYWKTSAIFVLEDDAQNGPDHVDAHRSPALVISPFARRRAVDSTLYTTSGMLRTMELILGVEPMSQYDAAAQPMYGAFQPTPVATPFTHLPARVPIDEMNAPDAPNAAASMRLNLKEADLAPDIEFSRIIWQAVRGRDSVMPPPVRAAFVRGQERP